MKNRQQQKQVLDKPNLQPVKKSSSSSKPPVAKPAVVKDPGEKAHRMSASGFGEGSVEGRQKEQNQPIRPIVHQSENQT